MGQYELPKYTSYPILSFSLQVGGPTLPPPPTHTHTNLECKAVQYPDMAVVRQRERVHQAVGYQVGMVQQAAFTQALNRPRLPARGRDGCSGGGRSSSVCLNLLCSCSCALLLCLLLGRRGPLPVAGQLVRMLVKYMYPWQAVAGRQAGKQAAACWSRTCIPGREQQAAAGRQAVAGRHW